MKSTRNETPQRNARRWTVGLAGFASLTIFAFAASPADANIGDEVCNADVLPFVVEDAGCSVSCVEDHDTPFGWSIKMLLKCATDPN